MTSSLFQNFTSVYYFDTYGLPHLHLLKTSCNTWPFFSLFLFVESLYCLSVWRPLGYTETDKTLVTKQMKKKIRKCQIQIFSFDFQNQNIFNQALKQESSTTKKKVRGQIYGNVFINIFGIPNQPTNQPTTYLICLSNSLLLLLLLYVSSPTQLNRL